MREYQGYLFDFDGTLFDTYHSLIGVYEEGFKAIGQSCTKEEVAIYMHFSLHETALRRNLTEKETAILIGTISKAIDYPKFIQQIEVFPDAIPSIKALKGKGAKIGLVSGNTVPHIRLVLERFKIADYFDMVVGSSPKRQPKPSGDPIFFAKESWPTLEDSEIVYVGDSLQDPETAHNGKVAALLLDRRGEYPNFKGEKISSLSELLTPARNKE